MSGTVQTVSQLLAGVPTGGPSGGITPTQMQNVVASMSAFAGLDDPNNSSSLGAPAIIRGTVYGAQASGLTVGAGMSTAVRQANATALQAAITYASANNKYFELDSGTYEINNAAGLVIPYATGSGFTWRGGQRTVISQFYTAGSGAPILTVGDSTGVNIIGGVDIQGMVLQYGTAVTGLTSANGLVLGGIAWSKLSDIAVGQSGSGSQTNPAYRGIYIAPNGGSSLQTFFSNVLQQIVVQGAQQDLLTISNNSTGSIWQDIYLGGGAGSGSFPTINGSYLNISTAPGNEGNFEQINCEWGTVNTCINLGGSSTLYGLYLRHLHFEGIKASGSNSSLIQSAGNALTVDQISMVDCYFNTANMTGTGSVFLSYFPGIDCIKVNKMVITTNNSGEVNAPVVLFNSYSGPPSDYGSSYELEDFKISDSGGGNWIGATHLSFDAHMPVSSSAFLVPFLAKRYSHGIAGSTLLGASILVSATYTHYGQLENANLYVPASITSFTITLATTMGATGTQKPRTGNWVHVRRQSGSASGTLTVAFGGTGTPTTNTTAAADYYYIFDGTTWQTFTPVS